LISQPFRSYKKSRYGPIVLVYPYRIGILNSLYLNVSVMARFLSLIASSPVSLASQPHRFPTSMSKLRDRANNVSGRCLSFDWLTDTDLAELALRKLNEGCGEARVLIVAIQEGTGLKTLPDLADDLLQGDSDIFDPILRRYRLGALTDELIAKTSSIPASRESQLLLKFLREYAALATDLSRPLVRFMPDQFRQLDTAAYEATVCTAVRGTNQAVLPGYLAAIERPDADTSELLTCVSPYVFISTSESPAELRVIDVRSGIEASSKWSVIPGLRVAIGREHRLGNGINLKMIRRTQTYNLEVVLVPTSKLSGILYCTQSQRIFVFINSVHGTHWLDFTLGVPPGAA